MKLLLVGLIGAVIGVACTVAYYEWWESELDEETAAIQPTYPGHIALRPKHSAGLPDINSGQPWSESRHEPP